MNALRLIFFHPTRAAEGIRRAPHWLAVFLLIATGMVALRLVSHSSLVESTLAALPASATEADRIWARSILDGDLLLRCAVLPLRLLAGMGTFAFFLHQLCAAFDPPVRARFKQVLALEIHAEVLVLLGAWAAFLVIPLTAGTARTEMVSVALLTSPKIFTLWYVVALAAGITTLFGCSKPKAAVLASTAWIVSVLFNTFLLQSVSASMHFHL
jgi:hypothetical protein